MVTSYDMAYSALMALLVIRHFRAVLSVRPFQGLISGLRCTTLACPSGGPLGPTSSSPPVGAHINTGLRFPVVACPY